MTLLTISLYNRQYQELFSLAQALCGPASTKLLYCINLYCEGTLPAILVFFLWR